MSADSTKKTIIVALGVCIVCSILVAASAVTLKDKQEENKRLDKMKNILEAAKLLKEDTDIETTYNEKITPVIIDLSKGEIIPKEQYTDILNPEKFDIKSLAKNPMYNQEIPEEKDKAKLNTIPKNMIVYEVKEGEEIKKIVFPIYGKGLYGTLYGVIALNKDLRTVEGLTFYEQSETPGLGGEVDNPRWKEQWEGKVVYGENWDVKITVNKKGVVKSNLDQKYQIDGLSGATMTTRGVNNLVRFWMGEEGYAPFIKNLSKEI